MVKLIALGAILSLLPAVSARIPGWFQNIRGGTTYYHGLYPDALSNVVHGYAEIDKHTDDKIDAIHEVKSTASKKDSLLSDDEYDEDPFFHALLHNNDDDKRVVNVSSESTKHMQVDDELFEKLHKKLFSHHDEDHDDEPTEKVTYGIREFIADSSMYE
eukprot:241540_1